MTYQAVCSYEKNYKNFWTMNMIIMKKLSAHFKVLNVYVLVVVRYNYYSMPKVKLSLMCSANLLPSKEVLMVSC